MRAQEAAALGEAPAAAPDAAAAAATINVVVSQPPVEKTWTQTASDFVWEYKWYILPSVVTSAVGSGALCWCCSSSGSSGGGWFGGGGGKSKNDSDEDDDDDDDDDSD